MGRNDFMRLAAAGTLGCALGAKEAWAQEKRPPNVVLMFSDDQGTVDLGCYGSSDLFTPRLDALAAEGVRFSQFYVGSPVCSPSRAALLTGRYPHRAGVPNNVPAKLGLHGLAPEEVTIAEMLRPAGYRTALFGKWHLGTVPERDPLSQGFDEFVGHRLGCIDNYSHFFYWEGPNRHDLWKGHDEHFEDGTFFGDIVVREALRFMQENRERPFFLYLPFNLPHYPLQAKERFRTMYEHLDEPRRAYAALVSNLDDLVGQVLDGLKRFGLDDNTLVLFMSDNGHSTEERNNFGGGNAGQYRGAKFSLFEGGIRMPCMARFPGVIPQGEVRGQFCASVDWFPTIAELCGVPLPEREIDGRSLVPIMASGSAEPSHNVFHWQVGGQWAVREGDWKLLMNPLDGVPGKKDPGDLFLANLALDPTEQQNFADQNPEIVARLTQRHEQWAGSVGAK